MRFNGELRDLETVRMIGDQWGYGNCIQYLQHAWAKKLMKDGFDRRTAGRAAFMTGKELTDFAKGFSVLKEDRKEYLEQNV